MTPVDAPPPTLPDPGLELDSFLAAFEAAAAGGANPDPVAFLPPPDHPLYSAVLRELLRVDLEFAWSRGERRRVEHYRDRFPELFDDPEAVRDLAGEEYRLRKAAGERPDPREYRDRLGADLGPDEPHASFPDAWPADRVPALGDTIPPGYHLVGELGRGAFGRVFLARETVLGGRLVAVKVSPKLAGEPLTLARLQHTNIVPVYAAHAVGRSTALVMPFLGRTTLADLIASVRAGQTPPSGRGMVSTLADRGRGTAGDRPPEAPAEAAPAPGLSRATLDALERMTFVEAVLWIGAELADGLAHAHDRGVLHRDIKPANVLLTDDGRPMLLDFNLAAAEPGQLCGTLGYMAPEQLEAARANRGVGSVQTDIYALGLVLVELLAGHSPFPQPRGRWEEALPEMIAARRAPPLADVPFPRDVTPGTRAILAKCLAPDPADRYASAADLRDDLNRQCTNRPLRFAREGSVRERVRKWARHHPRLSSGFTIAAAALLVVGAVTAGFLARQRHLERVEAEWARAGLRDAREFAQAGISFGPSDPEGQWRDVRAKATAALAPYRVESDEWFRAPLVTRLPGPEQFILRKDAAEVMFRAAHASLALALRNPAERDALLAEAVEWNRRARAAFPELPPRGYLIQRAQLLAAAGKETEARNEMTDALRSEEPTGHDLAGLGFAQLDAKQFTHAAMTLREVVRTEKPRYGVWMGLAAAEYKLRRFGAAIDALSAAAALSPASPWPYFHRGTARMELNDPAAATDFDEFLARKPNDPDGLLNRAAARYRTGDHRGAVADLDAAEAHGSTRTRLYAMRSDSKRRLGDAAGATRDRAAFLAKEPTDPMSRNVRGEFRRDAKPRDVAGALADFDKALEGDPDLLDALRNKASLLSEDPARHAEAIAALDRVLALVPTSLEDRAGRAVLLARVGRVAEAREEIEVCAPGARNGMTLYQLASAALVAGDKARGLALLRAALRKDPLLGSQMPADPDLQSVRKDPTFLNLLAAAGTLSRD
jgi:serine/threonine protein kinase/Flp pilus assembly protein TadD